MLKIDFKLMVIKFITINQDNFIGVSRSIGTFQFEKETKEEDF